MFRRRGLRGVQEDDSERGVVRILKETVMICWKIWKIHSGCLTLKLRKTAKTIIHRSSLNCNLLSCEQNPDVLAVGEAEGTSR
jgi:hypothetical protein